MATKELNNIAESVSSPDLSMVRLVALWHGRNPDVWRAESRLYVDIANKFLSFGESILTYDVAQEGLGFWPGHSGLLRLKAISLARCGAPREANQIMHDLIASGACDDETRGIFARTYKDLWLSESDPAIAEKYLSRALELYGAAYLVSGSYWLGVNVATLSWIKGDLPEARQYAEKVVQQVGQLLEQPHSGEDDYWMKASLGEASLVLQKLDSARDWYGQAALSQHLSSGNLASTRRNAKLLARYGCCDQSLVDQLFPRPAILVFTGHMADRPERPVSRFPASAEQDVASQIAAFIEQHNIQIGFAAAAAGADILFLEAMLALGRVVHIVLPFPVEHFIHTSVVMGGDDRWLPRFRKVLDQAATVSHSSSYPSGAAAYTFGNQVLFGLAKTKMRELDGDLMGLAVWNGEPGLIGGTGTAINEWRSYGCPVQVIRPDGTSGSLLAAGEDVGAAGIPVEVVSATDEPVKLVSFLFGDVVGFSKLTEFEIMPFVNNYLGAIAERLDQATAKPVVKNTWGDGLYFVFESVRDAGMFALDLVEHLSATDWASKGLPKSINIRIALHCGPAYQMIDPVTQVLNFTGSHVSRAARIEPVTPPGHVYCSQEFASMVAARNITEFRCVYVGQTPLAKGFGTFATFQVCR